MNAQISKTGGNEPRVKTYINTPMGVHMCAGDANRYTYSPAQAQVISWATEHASEAKAAAARRDIDGPILDRALEAVRKFISSNHLVLFGGLAIDYALRLKGAALYPDDERPDYDAVSPQAIDLAYKLADQLHAAGFPNVSAIRAVHVQTVRVRVDFRSVADFGYVPADVFEQIPTFDYRGIQAVHPDFQRIDMHLALCYPYTGAPREAVFHRWKKDLKRFNMFEKYYPIEVANVAETRTLVSMPLSLIDTPADTCKHPTIALTGFAGYAALRKALTEAADRFGPEAVKLVSNIRAPSLSFEILDNITFEVPGGAAEIVIVSSNDLSSISTMISDSVTFDPYLDTLPGGVRGTLKNGSGDLVVLSTSGHLLAVSEITMNGKKFYITTPQFICLYFLCMAHRSSGELSVLYRQYYLHTLEILQVAEEMWIEDSNVNGLFKNSPFALTVKTMGDKNADAAYTIQVATRATRLHDKPPEILGLPENVSLEGLPSNYYPGRGTRPNFDPSINPWFRRSGKATA